MTKRILLTGATDGIGLETAKRLVSLGHTVLLHGRNAAKLDQIAQSLRPLSEDAQIETYVADLSRLAEVKSLATSVAERHESLDVLINNAGVFAVSDPLTPDGFDVRFVVNTIAPYLLTQRLLPMLGNSGRVVNLSSAAQASVDLDAMTGAPRLSDSDAYAQSKLGITIWSRHLALAHPEGPMVAAINPGSLLGSKMVKEAYGMDGKDLQIGAEILTRAALDDSFASATGKYFDNDSGQFASPHPDALDAQKATEVVDALEEVLRNLDR